MTRTNSKQEARRSAPTTEDGFRPRKVRPAGWLKAAIKDGSVRDPSLLPEPEQVYPEGAAVIQPPVARVDQVDKEG